MNYQDYIRPELLILTPTLYFIGEGLKQSGINSDKIPLILGVISIILCSFYILPTSTENGRITAIFTIITQGVLIAGASVYANELKKIYIEE